MRKLYALLTTLFIALTFVAKAQVSAYSFSESSATYTALTGGTTSTATGDDGTENAIPIGFNFTYGGTVYTHFSITTNGFVKLGNATVAITGSHWTNGLSNTNTNAPLLGVLWDDNNAGTGTISYLMSGSSPSRVLTVDFNNVNIGGSGSTSATNVASYQVKIYETTNVVEFIYGTLATAGTLSASIGLNDNTSFLSVTPGTPGTASSATANNGISSTTNIANKKYTFTPPACSAPGGLNASAITLTTATIGWTASGTATSYEWELRTSGACGSGSPVQSGTTATTSVNLTGLTANTTYTYCVRSVCSGPTNSGWLSSTFNTLCAPTVLPYTENFNSVTIPSLPSCTYREDINGDGNTWTTVAAPTSPAGYSGNTLRYTYNTSNAANDWFYTSGLPLTGGTSYTLTFKYGNNSTSFTESMKVAYGSSPAAVSMTNLLATYATINTNVVNTVSLNFTPASTGTYYVGFQAYSIANQFYLYLDDISVTVTPACTVPTAISAGALSTSAAVSFTSTGSNFIVEYGAPGFTPGTGATAGAGGTVVTGTASPINITGLTPNTTYEYYVRQVCTGPSYSANSAVGSFTTACAAVTASPVTESFGAGLPTCWAASENTTGSSTHWTTGTADATHGVSGPQAGTHFAFLDVYNASTTYNPYYLKTIPFTLSATQQQVKYYYYLGTGGYKGTTGATGADPYPLLLQVSTNGTTWTDLYGHTSANSVLATSGATSNWTLNVVDVGAYSGQTVVFRFVSRSNFGVGFCNQGVDEFTIEAKPAVDAGPTALIIPSVSCPTTTPSTIQATIKNFGSAVLNFATNPVNVSVTVSGAGTGTLTGVINTGTLAVGATTNVTLTPTFTFSNGGTYNFSATASATGDGNSLNNNYSTTASVGFAPSTISFTPATPAICVTGTTPVQLKANGGTIPGTVTPIAATTTVSATGNPYRRLWGGSKLQFIYTAAELTAAGITANTSINSIGFNVTAVGGALPNLTISMGHTASTSFATTTFVTGLTTVFSSASAYTPVVGLNTHTFSTPFVWNGTGNVIVEVCFATNDAGISSSTVSALPSVTNSVLHGTQDNTAGYCTSGTTGTQGATRPAVVFGYDAAATYKWYPSAGLFTDAAGTTPYTGTSVNTVYAKPSTSALYTIQATTGTGCQNNKSVDVFVDQTPAPVINPAGPVTICNGQVQALTVTSNSTGTANTTTSAALALAIPDNNPAGITNDLTVSGVPAGAVITGIAVKLNLSHTWDADMVFNLKAPNNNILNLINRRGSSGDNFNNTVISSYAGLASVSTGTAPFNNGYAPDGVNAVGPTGYQSNVILFTGLFSQPNGTWTLAMQDAGLGDFGALNSWSITIYYLGADNTTWSAVTELYSNSGATTPYTGTNLATVYAKPTTTRTYTVTSATPGGCSATSSVTINVNQLPAVTTPPVSQSICPGNSATFTVTATGTGLTYQWRKGGVNLTNGGNISGATTNTLTISNAVLADAGNYDVVVSGTCSPAATSAVAVLSVGAAPIINTQPVSQIACAGNTVTFSALGAGPGLTYQWRKGGVNLTNGGNISGATSSTLTVSNITAADAGNYDVVITNACSQSSTSTVAVLTFSASNRWLGVANSDWSNPNNWCNGVPTSTTDVTIPAGTLFPAILAGNGDVKDLTIQTGASLLVTASGYLSVYGSTFTNSGTFTATAGTIVFRNTANLNWPGMSVANVIMNGAGGVTLTGNLNVTNALTLTNGNITLGTNNLVMTGGTVGSIASHIVTSGTGVVTNNNVGIASVVFPVGPTATSYNPLQIANGGNLNYNVRVATGVPGTLFNGARAINRTWTVSASGTPASAASLTFGYADADANASCGPTANMEIGYFTGTAWNITTPAGGSIPSGTATLRQVYTTSTAFGNFVVANIGGINIATGAPTLDADLYSVKLLPNIVDQTAVLRIMSRRAMNVEWAITDIQGRVVMKFNKPVLAGQNDMTLRLGHLANGTYQVMGVTEKGKTNVIQFIKL